MAFIGSGRPRGLSNKSHPNVEPKLQRIAGPLDWIHSTKNIYKRSNSFAYMPYTVWGDTLY
jgi:hypothetical protein